MRWRSGIGRSYSASGRTIPKSASVSTRASISRDTNFRRLLASACVAIIWNPSKPSSPAPRATLDTSQFSISIYQTTALEVNWHHREYGSLRALATFAPGRMAEDLSHPSHVDADRWQGPHGALPAHESLVARRPICQLPWSDDGTNTVRAGRLRDSVRLSEACGEHLHQPRSQRVAAIARRVGCQLLHRHIRGSGLAGHRGRNQSQAPGGRGRRSLRPGLR